MYINLDFFFFTKLFHTFDHKRQPNINAYLDVVTYCCPIYKYYEYFRVKNLLRNKFYSDIICKYCIKKCKVLFEHTNEKPKYVAKLEVEYFKICSRKWLQTYCTSFGTFARHQL